MAADAQPREGRWRRGERHAREAFAAGRALDDVEDGEALEATWRRRPLVNILPARHPRRARRAR
jgi:antitoxin (DNA-binding transcriptional repressor) of toxin-antitoxin stability system